MAKPRRFEKLAIANRGEVAVRIIRACQELGIETVLLHSSADERTLAARMADETVCIGEAPSAASYLNIQANVQGALAAGADAIHPGFGFLSENADFADAVTNAGMVFVGPSSANIRLFGDKISAKSHVEKAGGPVIPGYQGGDQSMDRLLKECERIGYPVICKAAAGGGGRGLKVIRNSFEAQDLIQSAQREAQSAFGSSQVFLEKYLDHAKHIEVQVFGHASGHVTALLERECSVQRRHQKIIEEALSPSLDEDLRRQIAATARELAESAGYRNAGTVEFLLQDGQFYFMEMNTRLQVEHPVTELVMGVDLVKAQILTAMGESTGWPKDLQPRGHAIECRLYAEDPYQNGIPSTGRMLGTDWPHGPGRRFEVGFEAGDEVTSHYDSMIAKVIVWDETRVRAIQKMKRTLQDTIVFGVHTNIPLLQQILSHEEFLSGKMTTRFFETHFNKALPRPEFSESENKMLQTLSAQLAETSSGSTGGQGSIEANPWAHTWGQS
ncbi:MAG: ATP-grasp domain-containing protein [Bdellovibrionales bacterium]|nr:ATP-grasp domain-containing protein [Bdellovibrionales bacterium]